MPFIAKFTSNVLPENNNEGKLRQSLPIKLTRISYIKYGVKLNSEVLTLTFEWEYIPDCIIICKWSIEVECGIRQQVFRQSAHNMLPTLEIIKSISDVCRSYPYSGELGTIFGFLRSARVSLPPLVSDFRPYRYLRDSTTPRLAQTRWMLKGDKCRYFKGWASWRKEEMGSVWVLL